MKDDLISRRAAIELCDWYEHKFSECDHVIRSIAGDLKSLPPAEPERKQGEWMSMHDFKTDEYVVACSNCNMATRISCETIINADVIQPYKFCPNCGADMRGGINDV